MTAAGTIVGQIAADDPDGNILEYSIVSCSSSPCPFRIDQASGAIVVATSSAFSAEVQDSWQLVVQVSDRLGEFDTIEVEIVVLAVEDGDKENASIAQIDAAISGAVTDLIGQRFSSLVSSRANSFGQASG